MERGQPLAAPANVVVELQRLPRVTGIRVGLRIRRRPERSDRDFVAHDVVGMRVTAVLVVGRDHMRAERTDHLHQTFRTLLDGHESEAAIR